jgi:hypothetical protein
VSRLQDSNLSLNLPLQIICPLSTIHYPLSTIRYPLSTIHYPLTMINPRRWYPSIAATIAACIGIGSDRTLPAIAQSESTPPTQSPAKIEDLDLAPAIINSSPVLQKWFKEVPDVGADINSDPSFRTRVKVGYGQYPSTNQIGGFYAGVEDVFIGKSGFAISANYDSGSGGANRRSSYGAAAQYYLLPLGGYINIAPTIGFQRLETDLYQRDGIDLGVKLVLVPARGGGGDITLSQSWLGFGSATETGLTKLSVGYAVTNNLRISTDIQQQNAPEKADSRVGIGIEWMP